MDMTDWSTSAIAGMRIAVIGGSLGGLSAATLLRDAGADVTVYERSPVLLNGFGAGLVVHDATVRYAVERRGHVLEELSCGSAAVRTFGEDGTLVHEEPSSYRFTSWSTIYQTLLNAFDRERYLLGENLVGLDQSADHAEAEFESGRKARVDLIVCADGIGSTARHLLVGSIEPRYAGYVGWRGLVGEADLTQSTFEILHDAITYNLAGASHVVAYPIPNADGERSPGQRLVNYVWYRNIEEGNPLDSLMTGRDGVRRPVSLQPGNVQHSYLDALRRDAKELLAPPLAEMVDRTPDPFIQVIVDLEIPRMAHGRIAVIGDGAFAARPHAAAGTAKAAENAWKLTDALIASGGDVTDALARWEPGQLALGRQLVRRSREMGDRAQVSRAWFPGDPDLRFGLYGPGR